MAEQEFRRMLARAPGSGLDQRNLALTLLDLRKLATADSLLREMEAQPQLRRWVLELRGSRAVALHDHEALIRNEEAVAADSANDSASRIRALERLRAAIAMTGRLHSSDSLALMLQQRRDSLRDPGPLSQLQRNARASSPSSEEIRPSLSAYSPRLLCSTRWSGWLSWIVRTLR